jgi:hypothetical protein
MGPPNRCYRIAPVLVLGWLASALAPPTPIPSPITLFAAPGQNIVGLVWVEKAGEQGRFWASDRDTGNIYHQNDDYDNWEVWQTWPTIPGPLAWDGEGLWVVDESAEQIVRLEMRTDPPTRSAVPIPAAALREVPSITGLTWDGEALWLATGCGLCSKIFRLDPEDGTVLQSFFPSCEPRGIAFSHAHPDLPRTLWTVAYNGPHKPALLSSRVITGDPTSASSSQTFSAFGTDTGVNPPRDPIAIAIRDGGIWVVDRHFDMIYLYDPRPLSR